MSNILRVLKFEDLGLVKASDFELGHTKRSKWVKQNRDSLKFSIEQ